MTDKLTDVTDNKVGKITDSEIVKALEDKIEFENFDENGYAVVDIEKLKNILDLINRLQAENERLKNAYKQCAWERDIFAEDMKEEIKKDCSYLMLDIKTIKAEAYKECIEKVKALFPSDNEPYQYWEIHEGADNILKELVGEDK